MTSDWVMQLGTLPRAMLAEMHITVWTPDPMANVPTVTIQHTMPRHATPTPHPTSQPSTHPTPPPTPHPLPSTRITPIRQTNPTLPPPMQVPPALAAMDWTTLTQTIQQCTACTLCETRQHSVVGIGDHLATSGKGVRWMVIGEAPGEQEDQQGEPFVGRAGLLLDQMLQAVGRSRRGVGSQGVYIANVIKCRPPANRNPSVEEMTQCLGYLARQIECIAPTVILAMGRFAIKALLQTEMAIGRLRGQVHRYQGIPVVVTYHPAYLLRTPSDKSKAWDDLCLAWDAGESNHK